MALTPGERTARQSLTPAGEGYMKQPDRNRWRITLAATIATVGVLIGGATAYWQYVNYLPPFRPQLSKLPSPNGYLQAARILEGLSQSHRPPVPKSWPRCTPAE